MESFVFLGAWTANLVVLVLDPTAQRTRNLQAVERMVNMQIIRIADIISGPLTPTHSIDSGDLPRGGGNNPSSSAWISFGI
jgi:hypothetical protein